MDENPYASPVCDSAEPRVPNWLSRAGEFFEIRNWRLGALASVIVAAIVTPADPYSLFVVAIPLLAIYSLGVGLRTWFRRQSITCATAEVQDF